ncbi:MAG: lycopene cyclase family protein, partial [Marmoricola sp.]
MESRQAGSADVVVVGAGPAGWSLAHACTVRGLDTVVVAPRPRDVWERTLGLWDDQLDPLPSGAAVVRAARVTAAGRPLRRAYAVLDNASVLSAYAEGGTRTVSDTVTHASAGRHRMTVHLRGGGAVSAGVVVDASGASRVLSGGPRRGVRAEQTAYGLVVPAAAAAPLVPAGGAVFMDWDRTNGGGEPTFLYAVPLPRGRVLLEETCLARRPGLGLPLLEARLRGRLATAGVETGASPAVERVRFSLDDDVPPARPGVLAFGVAGGMMHPATGFSVGEVVGTAAAVAAALHDALPRGADAATRAGRATLWTPRARVVRRLRA